MLLLVVLLLFIVLIFSLKRFKRRYDVSSRIPGPRSWPIIGYTRFITANKEELFKLLSELQEQYGGLYKTWLFTELWVITSEPEIVEKVLNNQQQFVKSDDYEMLKPWLGTGLLISEGKKWFSRRKAITPAFHFKILDDFVKIFEKHADVLVEKFRTQQIIDVTTYFPLYTLDNICETAMGIEVNSQTNGESEYVKAIQNVAEISYKRMFNPLLWYNFLFKLTSQSKTYYSSLKVVHGTTQRVIEKRREFLANKIDSSGNDETQFNEFGRKSKMALLDVLLKTTIDGEPLSDDDIQEEVNTFLFAGHDTTSTACGFLLYNIAKHANVQEKLVTEIFDVIGKDKTLDITMANLNDLRYLDLVVKESLRYHTTVPIVGRQILSNTEIGPYLLPENTNLSINVYGMCHSKRLFPNPEKFWPERFEITESSERINPFAYIPFSAGPRNCIGQKFALLEIKMMAVKVLQNYEISVAKPDEELVFSIGLTLKVSNGIKLRFKERIL